MSVDDIISKNNLSSTVLQIGDILIIPNPSQIPSNPEEDNGSNDNNIIKYKVQPQDTLYSIAKKYEISVDALKKANNLNDNVLQIGQVLIIPSNQTGSLQNYINYTVIPGDTLYRLASIYNTTVDDIKRINNLTSNTLSIGQILKIPTNAYNSNENIITFDIDQ